MQQWYLDKSGYKLEEDLLKDTNILYEKLLFLKEIGISFLWVKLFKQHLEMLDYLLEEAHKLHMRVVLDMYEQIEEEEVILFKEDVCEDLKQAAYFKKGFDALRISSKRKKEPSFYTHTYAKETYIDCKNLSSVEKTKRNIDKTILEKGNAWFVSLEECKDCIKYNQGKATIVAFIGGIPVFDHMLTDSFFFESLIDLRNNEINTIRNGYTSIMDMKNQDVFSFKKIKEKTILVIVNMKEEEVIYQHDEEIEEILLHSYKNTLVQNGKIFLRPYEVVIAYING